MSALFLKPIPFVISAGSSPNQAATAPASNTALDLPGLVWRSANLTTVNVIIDLGPTASYDYVAIIGSNLRATDTVLIQSANGTTGVGGYSSGSVPAYTGNKPDGFTTKTIKALGSTQTGRYMRLDFTVTGHPDGYVQVQRIVVGKAVVLDGIDADCEQTFEDQSVAYSGPNYTAFDEYPVLPGWKIKSSWIGDAAWRTTVRPFLISVGQNKPFLFVPRADQPTYWQEEAIFGRITSQAKGSHPNHDLWALDMAVTAIAN
jgi:hypothetical protein